MESARDPEGLVHLADRELGETLCGLPVGLGWESTADPVTCPACLDASREVTEKPDLAGAERLGP